MGARRRRSRGAGPAGWALIGLAMALVSPRAAAPAAEVETGGAVPCAISGHTRDPDPRGTNVRAAPGLGAAVIGRLPPPRPSGGEEVAPEFDIVGWRDGWFLIRGARQGGYGDDPARVVFAGPGWVAAGLVGFTINAPHLLAAPREGARAVLRLSGETADGAAWGPDALAIERVHGCRGRFAEVSVRTPDGRRARGWASGICANQVTTCP